MQRGFDEIVEEVDQLKTRLSNLEKRVADFDTSDKKLKPKEDRVTKILKRAKIRSVEMAKDMTEVEVWAYYDKSVSALRAEFKNR